ncbi:MAG: hypothetical protein SVE93_00665 [Candidatus Thermoplasmatota archaeon]|nr:hypothetical protein [Candidatus Thermoplasmatota archaeon]
MQKFLLFLTILLISQYSIELDGNTVLNTPSINVKQGEKLVVQINQSGWVMVEILRDGESIFNNIAQGGYKDVNLTFDEPGNYAISFRNTHYRRETIKYSIMITRDNYSSSVLLG